METVLSKLYYGELCPAGEIMPKQPEYGEAEKLIAEMKREIAADLGENGQARLNRPDESYSQLIALQAEPSFAAGFSLCLKLVLEACGDAEKWHSLVSRLVD